MAERPIPAQRRWSGIGAGAAVLGGFAWLMLAPAAELVRRDLLSYDGYNRLLAVPLLLFAIAIVIALALAPAALSPGKHLTRVGLFVAAGGAVLLLIGNVVEFYGVLLQDKVNAYAASQAGADEHWIGSDVGWITFGLGILVLLAGGFIAALGLHRDRTVPMWLVFFTATLGVGVLAGNLFGLAPAFLSMPVLGLYAAGWMTFGRFLRSAPAT